MLGLHHKLFNKKKWLETENFHTTEQLITNL